MIKKIPISELKTGMYASGLEKEEPGNVLFFMNNILIRSGGDIQRFQNNGYKSVYIEIADEPAAFVEALFEIVASKGGRSNARVRIEDIDTEEPEPVGAAKSTVIIEERFDEASEADIPDDGHEYEEDGGDRVLAFSAVRPDETIEEDAVEPREFHEELKDAKSVRDEAEVVVREFLNSVRLGKDIDTPAVHDNIDRMIDSLFRNQDALASLARLKSVDDYTFAHSVNVCILSLTLGRHMGLKRESLHDLGIGAILHDVGKMLVPPGILKKPGSLTDSEFSEMKRHSLLGGELLLKTREIKEESRIVALQHHEKYDGNGYHKKLRGKDIHLYARIASVADVYDAMTSNRVYQKGMVPEEAMKKMYLMRETHFEPELVERLIKCLGIYPIGTIIELNTGEISIVKMTNHTHPLQPVVTMLFDKEKRPFLEPFAVDLKDEIGRWIVSSRDSDAFGVMVNGVTA